MNLNVIFDFLHDFLNSIWFKILIGVIIAAIIYFILLAIYRRACRSMISLISYKREFSCNGVYEGENVTLTETIYNDSFLPIFLIDIEGYIHNDLRLTEYEFDSKHGMQLFTERFRLLMPYMQIKRKHEIKCIKRGFYKLETVQMLVSNSSKYVDSEAKIYVYPAICELPVNPSPVSALQGDEHSKRWLMRDPFNISGIRDYCFGDPFNSINFKATARFGGFTNSTIKVNNRDFCSNRTIMIYINFQTDNFNPIPSKIYNGIMETFLCYVCALIRDATYQGYKIGLAANSLSIDHEAFLRFPLLSGELHARDMLRSLAKIRTTPGVSFTGLLDDDISSNINDCEIYVFTTYTDQFIDARLHTLERMSNSVNTIIENGKNEDEEEEDNANESA